MNLMKIKRIIIIALLFIWVGFIGAISFMEAWLKFTVVGVTKKIGLAIGSTIFNALNKVEIIISIIILIVLFFREKSPVKIYLKKLIIPFTILTYQSIYLLPRLDQRAQLVIAAMPVSNNYEHFIYIFLEILKTIALIIIAIQILIKHEYK